MSIKKYCTKKKRVLPMADALIVPEDGTDIALA